MGKDHPDWGGIYSSGQSYPLFDQAELAARLGSPVTYDRRGSVIWSNTFLHGLAGLDEIENGTGSSVGIVSDQLEVPPFSCVLTAGSTSGDNARIRKRLPVPVSLRVGYQASILSNSDVSRIYHNIYHYTGTERYYSFLLADFDAATLSVQDASGEVVIDDAFPDIRIGGYFSHFKLVCDLSDHGLVRGIVDFREYDLSEYTMASQASAVAANLRVFTTNWTVTAVTSEAFVDTMIVTSAEP